MLAKASPSGWWLGLQVLQALPLPSHVIPGNLTSTALHFYLYVRSKVRTGKSPGTSGSHEGELQDNSKPKSTASGYLGFVLWETQTYLSSGPRTAL